MTKTRHDAVSGPLQRRSERAARGAARAAWLTFATVCCLPASAPAQNLRTLGPLDDQGTVTYYIAEGAPQSTYRTTDRELAKWALAAWEREGNGAFHFVPAPEDTALVRIYWVPADGGEYGEMRRIIVDSRRGAAVFIRPDTDGFGEDIAKAARVDDLFRDTIVYLTCVHELGHALGLQHTDNFDDVMYFFGYGGDIVQFFRRYRDRLHARTDIANFAGISDGDLAQLRALYGGQGPAPAPASVTADAGVSASQRPLTAPAYERVGGTEHRLAAAADERRRSVRLHPARLSAAHGLAG